MTVKEPSTRKKQVAYAESLPLSKIETPICYFCEKVVTEEEYCYGCKHFVCEDCNENDLIGNHDVNDHQGKEFE